jgi:23S rRNA (cytosine1962-C5)-methyltransferase
MSYAIESTMVIDRPNIRITPKGVRHFESGHPWIYKSDLITPVPREAGIVRVENTKGRFLAQAIYSPASQISLRILSRGTELINREWFAKRIQAAIALRKKLVIPSNAIRLFFGESDGIPAFIVDQFADVISFQTLCAGIDRYKDELLQILWEELKPAAIVERNDVPVRKIEKLPIIARILPSVIARSPQRSVAGDEAISLSPSPSPSPVEGEGRCKTIINEGDLKFSVDVLHGQKTGAYLDQRDNRILAGSLAYGNVLDCFSYEGWFAVHMARKAESVLCVDSSPPALSRVSENAKLNGLESKIKTKEANGFDFLKEEDVRGAHYDCINLDPPPFVRSARDRASGFRGYKEINLRAMKLLRPKGILITSSCSHHFSDEDFEAMIADAAKDAKVTAQILYRRGAAPDHPTLAGFPESHYLKCRIIKVSV